MHQDQAVKTTIAIPLAAVLTAAWIIAYIDSPVR